MKKEKFLALLQKYKTTIFLMGIILMSPQYKKKCSFYTSILYTCTHTVSPILLLTCFWVMRGKENGKTKKNPMSNLGCKRNQLRALFNTFVLFSPDTTGWWDEILIVLFKIISSFHLPLNKYMI